MRITTILFLMLLGSAVAQMCHSDSMEATETSEISLCTTTLVFPENFNVSSSQFSDQEARYMLVVREALPQVWRHVETLLQENGWQRLTKSKATTRQGTSQTSYTCATGQKLEVELRQLGRSFRYELKLLRVVVEE